MMYYIVYPFSWLLNVFYGWFENYGLAIILFALVVKIVLFPLTLKGKKGMIQMNMLSGKLEQLKKQYGKDQQRYNLEMQKLYEREKVNPMSGCLWSFLPILILLPLYAIIREPLLYMMGLNSEQILTVANALDWNNVAFANGWIRAAADFTNAGYNQLFLASMITEENLPAVAAALGEAGSNLKVVNFDFLGIGLALIPTWKVWTVLNWSGIGAFLMVMVSTGLSVLMSKVSMLTNKLSGQNTSEQAQKTTNTMMWMMPLMSLWIGFSMPVAMCIYWIANSLFSMVQELLAVKLLKKDYEKARVAAAERARQEKEEEKKRKEEARLERERRAEEAKNKKKAPKPAEEAQENINKDDSREGLRAHARGRAYVPDRFGGVTPYFDPDQVKPETKAERKQRMAATADAAVTEKVDLTNKQAPAQDHGADENKENG